MSRVVSQALDAAAALIAAALGLSEVAREPLAAEEPEAAPGEDVGLVVALSEARGQETGFLMGASAPFEFEHDAAFELIAVGGSAEERRAARDEALACAAEAIAADPTLGGLVDWAELTDVDFSVGERSAHAAASLSLHYTAPTAMG